MRKDNEKRGIQKEWNYKEQAEKGGGQFAKRQRIRFRLTTWMGWNRNRM